MLVFWDVVAVRFSEITATPKEMGDMDDLVPSVCQGCRKIYSGGFTKLEQFAGKWMCPSCIDIEKKKLQAPTTFPGQHGSKRDGNYIEFALQHKAAFAAGSAAVLLLAGVLINPRIPILAALAAIGFWIVRESIQGSRQKERERAAMIEKMPYQHCLTCGHDFKPVQSALRGSTTMEVVLWILILWPIALVYSIWRRLGAGKAKVACIVCASTAVVPETSPAAIAHKRALGTLGTAQQEPGKQAGAS